MRVKVQIDVSQKLKRGMYLHEANGNKVWVTVTYERLPNFCFLCGILGHGAGKCPLRYEEGFIDPGENLPYGTWLRASTDPSRETSRLPLQANHHSKASLAPRGSGIFSFTSPGRDQIGQVECAQGKENTMMPLVDDRNLITNKVHILQVEDMEAATRKFITVPQKNRKKKAADVSVHDTFRQGKKPHLHLMDEETSSTAETATQSRRSS
ncbi:PREDICTED: uncharacterized protein LOC105958060 [Erythranthe guttata]|uniref:uncharacterized protein LOC105958060 n=1 Tax=Erythranthe guttata TaxID=4155 RepID=UPI00064DBBE5|nr:PREDICTED: uncharacterized protein LOC105958060 [Erythranthe guttata]XP_012837519.1 PREDICTED: uncharacterized protein LOC105958060 [Erythranthe guttata]|eukprot:XP_012837518.1 PREDICTED: uncharacterized protein LOC105958060 [Erythranthe guttata]